MATDLRVEAEDSPGQLAAIGGELGKAGINIDGFCAAVAGGRGVVHLLVEDADGARQALEGAGYTVDAQKEALVLSAEDRPGYLGEMAGARRRRRQHRGRLPRDRHPAGPGGRRPRRGPERPLARRRARRATFSFETLGGGVPRRGNDCWQPRADGADPLGP